MPAPRSQCNALSHKPMKDKHFMNWASNCFRMHEILLSIWPQGIFFRLLALQRILASKKFSDNEELIARTEAYLEAYIYRKRLNILIVVQSNLCYRISGPL